MKPGEITYPKLTPVLPSRMSGPMVRKISGKYPSGKICHLHANGSEVTDIPDIASTLAQTFSDNSSSEQHSTKFKSFQHQAEKQPLNFKSKKPGNLQ